MFLIRAGNGVELNVNTESNWMTDLTGKQREVPNEWKPGSVWRSHRPAQNLQKLPFILAIFNYSKILVSSPWAFDIGENACLKAC